MHKILQGYIAKRGGIPLIVYGAALLVLTVVPLKLILILISLGLLAGGVCIYKRTGK